MFKFPYTNLHELNLDWILEKVKTLVANNDEFNDKADYAVETADEAKTIAEQAAQAQIGDGAVTTVKLADDSVTAAKLADNSVYSVNIVDGEVGTSDLAEGAVTTSRILDGAVTGAKIFDGAVTSAKLGNGAVTNGKISDNAVTTPKIADDAVTADKINASGSIHYMSQEDFPAQISAGAGRLIKDEVNNTVRIYMICRSASDISTSTVLYTIPEEYRPTTTQALYGIFSTSSANGVAYYASLNSSGQITQVLGNTVREMMLCTEYKL